MIPEVSKFEYELIKNSFKKVLKVDIEELCKKRAVDFEDLIDIIYIAPCSQQSEVELREYIKHLGYRKLYTKVKKSDCPLRLFGG